MVNLLSVYFFFNSTASHQSIHQDILLLPNAVCTINTLIISTARLKRDKYLFYTQQHYQIDWKHNKRRQLQLIVSTITFATQFRTLHLQAKGRQQVGKITTGKRQNAFITTDSFIQKLARKENFELDFIEGNFGSDIFNKTKLDNLFKERKKKYPSISNSFPTNEHDIIQRNKKC